MEKAGSYPSYPPMWQNALELLEPLYLTKHNINSLGYLKAEELVFVANWNTMKEEFHVGRVQDEIGWAVSQL